MPAKLCTIVSAVTILLTLEGACSSRTDESLNRETNVAAVSTGNPANDALLKQDAHQRAIFLGALTGKACTGTGTFYQGIDHDRDAYWDVECEDGRGYQIRFDPDVQGSTTLLACDFLEQVGHIQCFKTFDEQQK